MHPYAEPLLAQLLAKFAAAPCCWFASVRPDGRAHLAPIWHIWHNRTAYVMTMHQAVRAQNIRNNPHVSLSLPDPMDVFILEGLAHFAPEIKPEVAYQFQDKYGWDMASDGNYDALIAVTPIKAMAWGGHGEGRWRFQLTG